MANRFETMPPAARAGLGCALLLVALLLVVGLAEAAVRIRAELTHGDIGAGVQSLLVEDKALGLRTLQPNLALDRLSTNSLGLRGPEPVVPKPPGTIRIAFLGASTTFSAEASSEASTWPAQAVALLRERFPNRRFDYVNAGVPGIAQESMRALLRHRVAATDPDVIVIYEATNELAVQSRQAAQRSGLWQGNGGRKPSWLARHLMLADLAEKNIAFLRGGSGDSPQRALSTPAEQLARPYARELAQTVALARRVAPQVAVVTFTSRLQPGQTRDQLAEGAASSLYMPYMTPRSLADAFQAYNAAARRVAARAGVPVIEAERAVPPDEAHFTDSVHLSDRGGAAMGRAVGEGLARILGPRLAPVIAPERRSP